MTKKPSYRSFLPLSNKTFSVVPIVSLEPDGLKSSAKEAKEINFGEVSHTTILNQTVKKLGFKGGFVEYSKKYWPQLQKFMKDYGLLKRTNLIRTDFNDFAFNIHDRRALADRLFLGKELPRKIFTGFGVSWNQYRIPVTPNVLTVEQFLKLKSKTITDALEDTILRNQSISSTLERGRIYFGHYLHDFLIDPTRNEEYFGYQSGIPLNLSEQYYLKLFRKEIESLKTGWVDVIPFNRNLIFLSGINGEYDFVFRNLRNTEPPEHAFAKGLCIDNIPSLFWQNGLFDYLYYFQMERWDQKIRHEAAINKTKNGDWLYFMQDGDEYLKKYLKWEPSLPKLKPKEYLPEGFVPVKIPNGPQLYVQENPVSIESFLKFMGDKDNGYYSRRLNKPESPWQAANLDSPELPACVTYYDALAYTDWLEKKYGIPLRFLKIDEYKYIHPFKEDNSRKVLDNETKEVFVYGQNDIETLINKRLQEECVEFLDSNGLPITWKLFEPKEWESLQAHFKKDLKWQEGLNDINFLIACDFGEWLFEHSLETAAAIRTENLTGIHAGHPVEDDYHPMISWGKYKKSKIGFRLCFQEDYIH